MKTLNNYKINGLDIDNLIEMAIKEDINSGDHSSLSTIPADAKGKANLVAKDSGIICGVHLGEKIFHHIDPSLIFKSFKNDGDTINKGDIIFTVEGKSISILTAERLVLNFMQRMSGISTQTNRYCKLIEGCHTKLLDTRKTTPLMRGFEKYAVYVGGGSNHRFGLFDMIMIKDNHIDFAGGIKQAIDAAHKYLEDNSMSLKIEIEVRTFEELDAVLECGGIDRIMLDNFSPENLLMAVKIIDGRYETEASGGIVIDTIRQYAETGVDFISVGALTHKISSLDLSLKVA